MTTNVEQLASEITPLQASALLDCCKRGSTRTNDGGMVDTLLSGLCSNRSEGILNGWLVTWHHNHPRANDDHYISRYEPTELGRAVAQAIDARSDETACGLGPKGESAVRQDAP